MLTLGPREPRRRGARAGWPPNHQRARTMPPSKAKAMACWLRLVDTTRRIGAGIRLLAPGVAARTADRASGEVSSGRAEPASNDDGPPIGDVPALLSGDTGSGSVDGTAGSDSPGVPTAEPVPRAMLPLPAGRNCTENGAWLAGAGTRATSYVPPCACSD